MIKDNNYIVIQGFMVNELKLKGAELMVYAIIYGFSQDGKSKFTGSWKYLATWCNVSEREIAKVLKKLVEKELIIKEKTMNKVQYQVGTKFIVGVNKVHGVGELSSHNNIDNNIEINRKNERKEIFDYKWLDDSEV